MVFSDTTTKLGLIQDCEKNVFQSYGDISGNSERLYDFTARLNRSYDKAVTIIMSCDGRWQFDDSNYTDLPIGSTDIVSGQADYTLDIEHLDIIKIVALDTAGNQRIMTPLDIADPQMNYFLQVSSSGNSGTPMYYDKHGSSLFLYPTPNYNKTAGLIVYFQRKPSYFAYTDTTKSPGLNALFHRYLSLDASLDYVMFKQMTVKNDLDGKVKEMEALMTETISRRSRDEGKYFRPVVRSSR